MKKRILVGIVSLSLAVPSVAFAAATSDSELTQTIGAGAISTSIRDAAGDVVASPSFAMSSAAASTDAQTTTGTFGTNSQRITVDNPHGADNGWSLALAGTSGGSTVWSNGTATYPFNGTTTTGRLSVDPSVATLSVTSPATSTGITLGSASSFTGATPITLLSASDTADKSWNGYITGVGVSQIIPANQETGSYTLDLTQTVTAL